MNDESLTKFWNDVNKNEDKPFTKPCWEWIDRRNNRGQGIVKIEGKVHLVHNLSWELHNGDIPEGMLVKHHCYNSLCVNPDHLFLHSKDDIRIRTPSITLETFFDILGYIGSGISIYEIMGQRKKSGKSFVSHSTILIIKNGTHPYSSILSDNVFGVKDLDTRTTTPSTTPTEK